MYLTSITTMCILSLPRLFHDLMLPVEELTRFRFIPVIRAISPSRLVSLCQSHPLASHMHSIMTQHSPEPVASGELYGITGWHFGQIVDGSLGKGDCFVGVTGD